MNCRSCFSDKCDLYPCTRNTMIIQLASVAVTRPYGNLMSAIASITAQCELMKQPKMVVKELGDGIYDF